MYQKYDNIYSLKRGYYMLVIKMLKKASGLTNQELGDFLGKSRNTITSWEKDETTIPETEKRKMNERFNILPFYWNIGLNESDELYQEMYQKIKLGYELSLKNIDKTIDDPIDRILYICEKREKENTDHELEHYIYIQTLANNKDPINGNELKNNHFINNSIINKNIIDLCNNIELVFEEKYNKKREENNYQNKQKYIESLREWRINKANKENIKAFQIISDTILEELVENYVTYNNPIEKRIKDFPIGGKKYNLYYADIRNILENEEN